MFIKWVKEYQDKNDGCINSPDSDCFSYWPTPTVRSVTILEPIGPEYDVGNITQVSATCSPPGTAQAPSPPPSPPQPPHSPNLPIPPIPFPSPNAPTNYSQAFNPCPPNWTLTATGTSQSAGVTISPNSANPKSQTVQQALGVVTQEAYPVVPG